MTEAEDPALIAAVHYAEAVVNIGLKTHRREDLALTLFSASVALLVPEWGAERTLAALDEVIEAAARTASDRRAAH